MFHRKFVCLFFLMVVICISLNACQPLIRTDAQRLTDHKGDSEPLSQFDIENIKFANAMRTNLSNFKLDKLGISEGTMRHLLKQGDVSRRTTYLINEVWGEWIKLSIALSFDPMSTEPSYAKHSLSPFRQLVIRMVQGKQKSLTDAQQHALYNYFARKEIGQAWTEDMDGIIGAINRESFQWP